MHSIPRIHPARVLLAGLLASGLALGAFSQDVAFAQGPWFDNFDSYATGSQMHGQGGWKGWDNDLAFGALTSSAYARSAPNSVEIIGASDLVHEYSGHTSGQWVYTAWQYIPSTFSGNTYFIMLNTYNDAPGAKNWSVQVHFDSASGRVISDFDLNWLPLISGRWVEIRIEIDLDSDQQTFYYDGAALYTKSWRNGVSGAGALNIGAVDLYANATPAVYYDDLSLTSASSALSISKSASPATYDSVGDVISYSYQVTNSGNVTLSGPFTVSDDQATDQNCPATASLNPGAFITCTASYTVTQADLDAGSVTNTATASGFRGTSPVTSAPDSQSVTAVQTPGIQVVKEVSPDSGLTWQDANTPPGPTLTAGPDPQFRFTVTNSGNVTLTNPSLTDSDYSTASCPPPPDPLAPAATFSCVITEPWALGLHTDTATASGRFGGALYSETDDANYTGAAAPVADPAVTKTGNPATAQVGDTVTFTIIVTNNGTADADDVTLADPIPAFLDIVNISVVPAIPPADIVIAGNNITVYLHTLTPAETYTVTVTTVVNSLGAPPGGTNRATVATTSPESDPDNNASTALVTIITATGVQAPATGFAPDRTTVLPAQPAKLAYLNYGDLWIEIPALGVKMTIIGVPLTEDGWDVTWLGSQAGYLYGTAFPTWKGNSVITSHAMLASGRAGPFRSLKNLRWDDTVIVHYAGQRYVYSVRSTSAVMANDASILRHEERSWLTLVTCGGYDAKRGDYRYRIAVKAVLMSIESEP